MLFKLLRYDLRAAWKQFSLIWGTALALGLVNRFTLFRSGEDMAGAAAAIAYIFVIAAMFVVVAVFIIQRFYKGLLGDEGYLMHTLPVRPWQLVLSKLICAVLTGTVSTAVALLSLFLAAPVDWSELFQIALWREFFRVLFQHPDALLYLAEFFLLLVAAAVFVISLLYLSMAIGHLFSRRRALMSVAAFIGLDILLNSVLPRIFFWDHMQVLIDSVAGNGHASILTASACLLLPAVLFLAGTCWILGHRLNLE